MKAKKTIAILLMITLLILSVLSGCSSGISDDAKTEYENQIQQLQEEVNRLNEQLAQYTGSESTSESATISSEPSVTEVAENTETAQESGEYPTILPYPKIAKVPTVLRSLFSVTASGTARGMKPE